MKLLVEPRVTIERGSKLFMRYGKLVNLAACLEMIKRIIEPVRSAPTGRKLRAAVLHGPRNLKLEYIPEEAVSPTQVLLEERFFRVALINRLACASRDNLFPAYEKLGSQQSSRSIRVLRLLSHLVMNPALLLPVLRAEF